LPERINPIKHIEKIYYLRSDISGKRNETSIE
jgi:hypothetical protein